MENQNDIDFVAIIGTIWRRKLLVATFAIIGGLVALFFALTAIPIYRAEVVITPAHDTALGGSGSLATQLGGLASIAGVDISANGPNVENTAVLESRDLIQEFVKRNGVVPLMNINPRLTNPLWFAVERFKKDVLVIHNDKMKGITTITVDWTDPAVAARWANDFVSMANDMLRERAVRDSTRNIAFLDRQIAQTKEIEVQRVMSSLIESETATLMLASGRTEYAFTVVDPAVVPQVRASPRRTLRVLSGLTIGGILGAIAAIILNFRDKRATDS